MASRTPPLRPFKVTFRAFQLIPAFDSSMHRQRKVINGFVTKSAKLAYFDFSDLGNWPLERFN